MQPLPPDPGGTTDPQPMGADLSGVVTPNVDLAPSAFSVATIAPATGSTMGGYQVTITGTGFDKNTKFSLDNIQLVDVQIVSDTQAKAFVAKSLGSFGKVALRATRGTGNDIASKADAFNFVPIAMQFKSKTSLKTLASNSYQLAIADFNGDGKPDIATDSGGSNVGVIFLNKTPAGGLPLFDPPTYTASVDGQSIGINAADFNNDGKADLLINRYNSQLLNVFIGNGNGTFNRTQQLSYGGNYAYFVALGDLNGDGKLDAVTQSAYSNCRVHTHMGDGNGGFTYKQLIDTPCHPETLTLADFDGDGKLDVAMPYISSSYMFSIYRGDGTGNFINSRSDFNGGPGQFNVAVGDLNGDNKPDIITGHHNNSNTNVFTVWLNTSNGAGNIGFSNTGVNYPVGSNPYGSFLADLDNDGKLDAMIGNYDSSTMTIYKGTGDGKFMGRIDMATGGYPRNIGVADFNGDKKPDIAVVEHSNRFFDKDGFGVTILINDAQ